MIAAVDDTVVNSSELVSYNGQAEIGQQMMFHINRHGDTLEITVTVGEQFRSVLEQKDQQSRQTYPGNFPWGRPCNL